MQQRKRALLIEDDRDIALSVRLRLEAAGYDTSIRNNAEDGLIAAADEQPDVILLDIRLPKMDGLTALKRLRAGSRTRNIPVITLSASIVDQNTALEQGARFFLKKPFDAGSLIKAVDVAVDDLPRTVHV